MKARITVFPVLLLLIMLTSNVLGCSRFVGPSDEEIIKAINEAGLFSGGVEKFTLKGPIVILDKGMFSRNGAWPVKVRLTYIYTMVGGHETKPTEKIQSFRISKSKDISGNTVWKAETSSQ